MGHAIQSVSSPPCHKGAEGGGHNQQNIRSRAAPSRDRGVLSIPDNLEAVLTATELALLLKYNFENRFWLLIGLSNPRQTPLALF